MVQWPVILKLYGDDELVFIKDEQTWASDVATQSMKLTADDFMIDSAGTQFRITRGEAGHGVAEYQHDEAKQVTLAVVAQLVRLHAASRGTCCVSKLTVRSVAEAMQVVADGI